MASLSIGIASTSAGSERTSTAMSFCKVDSEYSGWG